MASPKLTNMMGMISYRNLPSKHPWALEIHGQKTEAGTYTEKPVTAVHVNVYIVRIMHIHANHRIIKNGVGGGGGWARTREKTVIMHI